MIKKYKGKLILSSIVTLLPAAVGLLLWNSFPQRMATHWGLNGTADGWSGKAFSIFVMPLFLLLMHWFCLAVTAADPKNKNQTKKAMGLIFWICPVISLCSSAMVYAAALEIQFDASRLCLAVLGLSFVLFGNYLPKCRQNHTLGVRIKWTLENEENWNATHRFCGRLWVIGGALSFACVFLPWKSAVWILSLGILMPAMVIVPVLYSWHYHRIQMKNGMEEVPPASAMTSGQKKRNRISMILTAFLLTGCAWILFTGSVNIRYDETSFTIQASYWPDLTVNYEDIEELEYRENLSAGDRIDGFGSPRLLLGAFQNEEFGNYTRYSYTKCKSGVVLRVNSQILVIGGKDEEGTEEIYRELQKRTSLN